MDFYIDLVMEGNFPGSPDHNKYVVDEKVWNEIKALLEFHNQFYGSAVSLS